MICNFCFLLVVLISSKTVTSQVISSPGYGFSPGNFGADLPFGPAPGFQGPDLPFAPGPGCQGLTVGSLAASRGGAFSISSYSPITPTGMSIYSENTIEGEIGVKGQVPFLGAVGFEGEVPANGQSLIDYGCGNGEIKIEKVEVPPQNSNAFPGIGNPFGGFGW